MITLTFSKTGADDIVLNEDDLFDFDYEHSCFSGDTFELGGVNARALYLLIDNNDGRWPRGTFANSRITLEINGKYYGSYNAELPKRRNGIIELRAYDDMVNLDVEYPSDYIFPKLFWSVYGQCLSEAGLPTDFVLNALFNNGMISHEYTDYIYANSCRQLVSGMAEWNGGFCYINNDGKLQVDVFSKDVKRTLLSDDLMEFDYSDDTVTFTKVKTSQRNKTYEMGTDDGYTLVINNQYISYGLDDEAFEMYLGFIYDYYKGFTLTPMSFTLAEPDLDLRVGDRIEVYDAEENVSVVGTISKIQLTGNLSMTVTCGGFGNVASTNNFNPTSSSQTKQTKAEAAVNGEWENTTVRTPTTSSDGFSIKSAIGSGEVYAGIDNGIGLKGGSAEFTATDYNGFHLQSGAYILNLNSTDGFKVYDNSGNGINIAARYGPKINVTEDKIEIASAYASITLSNSGGIEIKTNNGCAFISNSNGIQINNSGGTGDLYINGKKVLTE